MAVRLQIGRKINNSKVHPAADGILWGSAHLCMRLSMWAEEIAAAAAVAALSLATCIQQ